MEPLFHVGQDVVALKTNPQGFFKKGDEFKILDIFPSPCKCKVYVVKILEYTVNSDIRAICTKCRSDFKPNVVFFEQHDFAPLQEIGDMTFEEAIGLVTEKEMISTS
jgi:hypothetical protein